MALPKPQPPHHLHESNGAARRGGQATIQEGKEEKKARVSAQQRPTGDEWEIFICWYE